jgi:hypothetical protein
MNALKVAIQNALSLSLNAPTTAWLSTTSAFQWLAEKDVGAIESIA